MREIYIIAHDMRSTHNVGSLLRTADGMGVNKVYLSGYTPYPKLPKDERLPHIARKLTEQIDKTALGSIDTQPWEHWADIFKLLDELSSEGIQIVALEQSNKAMPLHVFEPADRIAILLGTEVTGIPDTILAHIPFHVVIPMYGQKESFNVVQAAAMALYRLRFY